MPVPKSELNRNLVIEALSIINEKRTEADKKVFNYINKIGNMINLVNYYIRYFGQGMALVLKLRHEYREYIEACLESNYYAILSSVINRNERG